MASPGAGFDHDTNEVVILGADGSRAALPMGSKREIAAGILDAVSACRARMAGEPVGSSGKEPSQSP